MTNNIDYRKIKIEKGKDPKKYNYLERRAELLRLIEMAGHPRLIGSQMKLAERYDVVQSVISVDIKAVGNYISNQIGKNAKFYTEIIYNKAIQKFIKNNDFENALKAIKDWNDWMFKIGAIDKAPEKVEISGEMDIYERIRKYYRESKVKRRNNKT